MAHDRLLLLPVLLAPLGGGVEGIDGMFKGGGRGYLERGPPAVYAILYIHT